MDRLREWADGLLVVESSLGDRDRRWSYRLRHQAAAVCGVRVDRRAAIWPGPQAPLPRVVFRRMARGTGLCRRQLRRRPALRPRPSARGVPLDTQQRYDRRSARALERQLQMLAERDPAVGVVRREAADAPCARHDSSLGRRVRVPRSSRTTPRPAAAARSRRFPTSPSSSITSSAPASSCERARFGRRASSTSRTSCIARRPTGASRCGGEDGG